MHFQTIIFFSCLFLVTPRCCEDNTIQITGNAEIKVKPDIAVITLRVENVAKLTSTALLGVNEKISEAISVL